MKFRYLDGLRGLAAFIVVIDHFAISFFQPATDASLAVTHGWLEWAVQTTPLHLFVSGNFSVCVFFILSAIVLSTRFFRQPDRRIVVASIIKRYPRLAIPVLACVLLAAALMALGVFWNVAASSITHSNWLPGFWRFTPGFLNAFYQGLVGTFVSGSSSYNTVLWTMKIELIGSMLVFGLLLTTGTWRYRWLAYIIAGSALIHTYYVAFIMGLALSDHYTQRSTKRRLQLTPLLWIPALALSLYLASCPVGTLSGTDFGWLAQLLPSSWSTTVITHMLGALGIIIVLLYTPTLQRPLEHATLRYLGKLSFGLYLTHLYVIGTLASFLFVQLEPHLGYSWGFVASTIPSLIVIWAVAHWFEKLVDQPGIRLAGHINRWIEGVHQRGKSLRGAA